MKKIVQAALLSVCFSTSAAFADSSLESVDKLMDVMQMEQQMNSGFNAMMPMAEQLAVRLNLDEEGKQKLIEIYRDWFDHDVDRNKILNEISAAYAKAFSEEDVLAMIAFYETPTGQRLLQKMPELTQLGARVGMQEAQSKQGILEQRLQAFMSKYANN